MQPERNKENELPQDHLKETGIEFLEKFLERLEENEGFRSALAKKFLDDPQGTWSDGRPAKVKFKHNSTEYELNLERGFDSDRLNLSTTNEGVEEEITIWLIYSGTHYDDSGDLKKGSVERVTLGYRKTDWEGSAPSHQVINSIEATSKIRQFLREI